MYRSPHPPWHVRSCRRDRPWGTQMISDDDLRGARSRRPGPDRLHRLPHVDDLPTAFVAQPGSTVAAMASSHR